MKNTPMPPEKAAAAVGSSTELTARADSEALSGREKFEDTLSGALTRVLSRAGLGVRVVPKAPAAGSIGAGLEPPAAIPHAAPAPTSTVPVGAALPARDELITLVTLVLGSQLLKHNAAAAPSDHESAAVVPANSPAAPVDPLAGTLWQANPSPPVTEPAPPARPLPRLPITGAAPTQTAGKATPVAPKGRSFTIRY